MSQFEEQCANPAQPPQESHLLGIFLQIKLWQFWQFLTPALLVLFNHLLTIFLTARVWLMLKG